MKKIIFFIIFISNIAFSQTIINGDFSNLEFGWEFENSYLITNSPSNMTPPSLKILSNGKAIGNIFNMQYGYYSINMDLYTHEIIERKDSNIYCQFICESGESEILLSDMEYILFPYNDIECTIIISSTEDIIVDNILLYYHGTQNPNDITPNPTEENTPTPDTTQCITETPTPIITETITETPTITETCTPTIDVNRVSNIILRISPSIITFDNKANIYVYGINEINQRIEIENYTISSHYGNIYFENNQHVYYPNIDMTPYIDYIIVNYNNTNKIGVIRVVDRRNNKITEKINDPIGNRGPRRSSVLSIILH